MQAEGMRRPEEATLSKDGQAAKAVAGPGPALTGGAEGVAATRDRGGLGQASSGPLYGGGRQR